MPRVIHFEIHVDNPERAIDFYRAVLGWQFTKWPGPVGYWLVTTGPQEQPGINGGLRRTNDGGRRFGICPWTRPARWNH
jgi:hypothetical protein